MVFDTNIFISALAVKSGRADEAIVSVKEGEAQLIISRPIIHETLGALARKFDYDGNDLARAALFLSDLAETVCPKKKLAVLEDEPDNRILECALTGKAQVIVTGDKAMLELKEFQGIQIVSLKEFLIRL